MHAPFTPFYLYMLDKTSKPPTHSHTLGYDVDSIMYISIIIVYKLFVVFKYICIYATGKAKHTQIIYTIAHITQSLLK